MGSNYFWRCIPVWHFRNKIIIDPLNSFLSKLWWWCLNLTKLKVWFWDSEAWILMFVTSNKLSYLRKKNLEIFCFNCLVWVGFYNFLILGSFIISLSVWICYEYASCFYELFFTTYIWERITVKWLWHFQAVPSGFANPES